MKINNEKNMRLLKEAWSIDDHNEYREHNERSAIYIPRIEMKSSACHKRMNGKVWMASMSWGLIVQSCHVNHLLLNHVRFTSYLFKFIFDASLARKIDSNKCELFIWGFHAARAKTSAIDRASHACDGEQNKMSKRAPRPGVEPGSRPWQGRILIRYTTEDFDTKSASFFLVKSVLGLIPKGSIMFSNLP